MNLLRDGGVIRFKTDNVGLFDFSLEEIEAMGLEPRIVTRDLHASEWNEGNIMTEYEENFSSQGMKINMLELVKPAGFNPEVLPEFISKDFFMKEEDDMTKAETEALIRELVPQIVKQMEADKAKLPADDWAREAIAMAIAKNIMVGYPDGFHPQSYIRREEVAQVVANLTAKE